MSSSETASQESPIYSKSRFSHHERPLFSFRCTTLSVLLGQKEHFALSLTVCLCPLPPRSHPLTARGVFSLLDAACSSLCGMYLSAYACNIFPLVQQDALRRGEGARDRGTECELGFLSLFWKEYFKGLLHVIQLPRMKAPGKQDQLIIHQPHVPGRQQYHYHSKLPTTLYFCSGPKHSRPVNTFCNILSFVGGKIRLCFSFKIQHSVSFLPADFPGCTLVLLCMSHM